MLVLTAAPRGGGVPIIPGGIIALAGPVGSCLGGLPIGPPWLIGLGGIRPPVPVLIGICCCLTGVVGAAASLDGAGP